MNDVAPVAVVIPTFGRGDAVLRTLARISECRPRPAEIWVHVDGGDAALERNLTAQYPAVRILTSPQRLGPGGGRHRCLAACGTPYAVSFDDDSWPVDDDFFAVVTRLFEANPRAAIIGAAIWHRHENDVPRAATLTRRAWFTGCGHAIRLPAFAGIRGYLPRPVAYGLEENDIALQLFSSGWDIYESGELRVFHDTELRHHESPEITAGTAANIALFAFLNYPVVLWGWGALQLANFARYCLGAGRRRGLLEGLMRVPADCYRNRRHRRPVALPTLIRFLRLRRDA